MDAVEEIKARLSIEDVVGHYVDLRRSGASYKGLCPFHQEKTPSFFVTPARGSYMCFGCHKGGDIFSFVMEMERLTFPETLKRLAEQAGVELPEREQAQPSLKKQLHEANEAAARLFGEALLAPQGKRARDYLQERGFGSAAIETFGLGYAPEGRETLRHHLHKQGFEDRILLAAGLILQDENGGKTRDRFHGRLMFPIRDAAGKISGFGGRSLGDAHPKYLNSPQTEVFDKSAALFGIQRAQDAIRQARRGVLVEGYLDAIRAHMNGHLYTVASLGTAVTTQQLMTLSRLTDTVILALDPDAAGQAAAARTSLAALAEVTHARGRARGAAGALDLRVARLPEGHGDPDELIRDHPELWEQALAGSVSAFEFYFTQTLNALDRSSEAWRQEAIDRLLPVIQQFATSAGFLSVWLGRLAAETGVDPHILQRSIPGAGPSGRTSAGRSRGGKAGEARGGGRSVVSETTARAVTRDPALGVEQALVTLLLNLVVIPEEAAALLDTSELDRRDHRAIVERLLDWRHNANYDYEMFRDTLSEELRSRCDELRSMDYPLPDDGKLSIAIAYHLARLHHFRIQSRLSRARDLLEDVGVEDRQGAVTSLAELIRSRHDLEQELERLSQRAVQSPVIARFDSGND